MVTSVKKGLQELLDKGVEELYHANSVLTSCEFLRHGALLSRGTVEALKLRQTPQKSDVIDKRYHIWNDVFLDSVDIHARASTANHYGPVMFVLSTEKLISELSSGEFAVTKLNPTKWANKPIKNRWMQSFEEFSAEFDVNSFDQMVVLRHSDGHVPLKSALRKIIIDPAPAMGEQGVETFSYALGALKHAMHLGASRIVPITKRECAAGCDCQTHYADDEERMFQMYRAFIRKT
ncbi:hypothetical protein I4N56_014215 [Pseudomonas mohnii]|uniref:hypothetical protein n=1 Tax=Pseudomonas mohnii TaxID=395600 RepID=UPI0018DE97D7|nr:hypothetical protein [Pseudomonas mohnii]MBH8611954.1 hypothetical protein [Pseudomonas mohnii]